MAKFKKGQTLECVPCGREITISSEGVSRTTIYCCGRPMKQKTKAASKKTTKKSSKK